MKQSKAFLINTGVVSFRPGEVAEVLGVAIVTPPNCPPRPCYHIRYNDGKEDYVSIRDEGSRFENCIVLSEEDIAKRLQPLIEKYKMEATLRRRDLGASAQETYAEIKKLATPRLLIEFLESIK